MASNIIQDRVFDFLSKYPPFTLVEEERLKRLAGVIVVQYYAPGKMIFSLGEQLNPYVYVVRQGAVMLLDNANGNSILVDQCDEGDVFGVRPLIAGQNYMTSAQVEEESLIYAIPLEEIKALLNTNSQVALFFASGFAAGVRNSLSESDKGRIALPKNGGSIFTPDFRMEDVLSIDGSKTPVTCPPDISIRLAAQIMSDKNVGSIVIVDEAERPMGIITDTDLRKKVVTGVYSNEEKARRIMSSPVITVPPSLSVADVMIRLIRNDVRHLCITSDGTPESKLVGVISEHDLLLIQGNNPAILIKEIRKSVSVDELPPIRGRAEELIIQYLDQEVSIAFISTVISEINDAIIIKAIELAIEELRETQKKVPPVDFCWLSLGSEGRQEQLLRTDQDNAIVFDLPEEQNIEEVREYFVALAKHVTGTLHACGFEYCPADMMASNPQWCLSLEEWKAQFSQWIRQPGEKELMFATIFFDFRPVYGAFGIADDLTAAIFEYITDSSRFLSFLAKNALKNPPPLSFFRNFIVEKGGEHKNEFDIKLRAMMPLVDAARVLILSEQISRVNNTFKRFERLADLDQNNYALLQEAAAAYELLMRFRALTGFKQGNSGRYINPAGLNKIERMSLRNTFRTISELQEVLKVRFQLNYLL